MRKKFLRRDSTSARWSPRFGKMALLLLVVVALCQYFMDIDIKLLVAGVVICGLLALGGLGLAIRGFVDLWRHGDKGGHTSIKGILISLLTLLPTATVLALWLVMPPLYDVATDLETPPPFLTAVRPTTALPIYVNLIAQTREQRAAWPQLSGRRYDGAPDRVLNAVQMILEEKGWTFVSSQGTLGEDTEIIIAARASLGFIRLFHDVAIRLRDEEDTTFVDMRAAARHLPRDFGLSAYYITSFMNDLDRAVLLTPIETEE